jgi:hypothetical protein
MPALSKRRAIINYVITTLKEIDGGVSPYDSSYTFSSRVFNNVFRGASNYENINDFPTIQVIAGPERYTYRTLGNTEASLNLLLRCYLYNGDKSLLKAECDNLIQDIDHVIYKVGTNTLNLHKFNITAVDSDQGLLEDHSIIEVHLLAEYELETI